MQFVTQMTWDAPLERVLNMVTSPEYVARKTELMDYVSFDIQSCTMDGQIFTAKVRVTDMPSIELPAFAQRFIRQDQPIVMDQTDTWNKDTACGELLLENRSVSVVKIRAGMALSELDGITTNTLNWDVSCSVPLVGGKLAAMIADDIREKAARTELVSRQVLNELF